MANANGILQYLQDKYSAYVDDMTFDDPRFLDAVLQGYVMAMGDVETYYEALPEGENLAVGEAS